MEIVLRAVAADRVERRRPASQRHLDIGADEAGPVRRARRGEASQVLGPAHQRGRCWQGYRGIGEAAEFGVEIYAAASTTFAVLKELAGIVENSRVSV